MQHFSCLSGRREKFAVYKETIPYLAGIVFNIIRVLTGTWIFFSQRSLVSFIFQTALLIVSDDIRTRLRPNSSMHSRLKRIPDSLSSITPPNSNAVSPVIITIESPVSPGPAQVSEVETEIFSWPTEVENRLLDPGVVNDTQTQALLLATLVRLWIWYLGFISLETLIHAILVNSSPLFQNQSHFSFISILLNLLPFSQFHQNPVHFTSTHFAPLHSTRLYNS